MQFKRTVRSALTVCLTPGDKPSIAGGVGAYLGAYLKKKGENSATHEDIAKLVDEMKAVTQATKEVEAKISNEVWERQRRWDVRRDAVFGALQELAMVQRTLRLLIIACDVFGARPREDDKNKAQSDLIQKHYDALAAFGRAKILAMVACSMEVRNQFDLLDELVDVSAKRALAGDVPGAYEKLSELLTGTSKLGVMVRKDLGVEWPADPKP